MDLARCDHCGAVFPDDWTTCPKCGRDPHKRSRLRMLFWMIGIAGVVAMVWATAAGR